MVGMPTQEMKRGQRQLVLASRTLRGLENLTYVLHRQPWPKSSASCILIEYPRRASSSPSPTYCHRRFAAYPP